MPCSERGSMKWSCCVESLKAKLRNLNQRIKYLCFKTSLQKRRQLFIVNILRVTITIVRTKKNSRAKRIGYLNKKRKAGSSLEVVPQHENNRKAQSKAEKLIESKRAPPPINITGVSDYNSLRKILKATIATEFKVTSLRNDAWRIKVNDDEVYRAVSQKLNNEKIQSHTYEDKSERSLSVVATGLHPSCSKEDVIGDLLDRGYKILDAVNLLKKERKRPDRGEEAIVKR